MRSDFSVDSIKTKTKTRQKRQKDRREQNKIQNTKKGTINSINSINSISSISISRKGAERRKEPTTIILYDMIFY